MICFEPFVFVTWQDSPNSILQDHDRLLWTVRKTYVVAHLRHQRCCCISSICFLWKARFFCLSTMVIKVLFINMLAIVYIVYQQTGFFICGWLLWMVHSRLVIALISFSALIIFSLSNFTDPSNFETLLNSSFVLFFYLFSLDTSVTFVNH